jgi:hypothetical protein
LTASGLTHATGVNLAPNERLNLAASTDFGTLRDMRTGAETERRAAGFSVGYGFTALQLSTGIEFRSDDTGGCRSRSEMALQGSFKYQCALARACSASSTIPSVSCSNLPDGGYGAVLGYATAGRNAVSTRW